MPTLGSLVRRRPVRALRRRVRRLRERHFQPYVFIHINKTAGSSVERALGMRLRHITARAKRDQLGRRYWDRKFSFAFVRNPWDRAVSLYSYRDGLGRVQSIDGESIAFPDWVEVTFGPESPRDALMTGDQLNWLVDERQEIIVDFVGRFEQLNEDFRRICERIGVQAELPHVKASVRGPYADYFDDLSKRRIADWFARDIEAFGYRFGE